jgi:hypothetical protein
MGLVGAAGLLTLPPPMAKLVQLVLFVNPPAPLVRKKAQGSVAPMPVAIAVVSTGLEPAPVGLAP